MLSAKNIINPKIWLKCTKSVKNGAKLNFRWEQLTGPRYEEFLDFKMNNFVKHELTHVVSGIPKSVEAMEEFRDIVANNYNDPSYNTLICCVDDKESKIVAFDSLKLYRRGEQYKDTMQAKTAEVNRFYEILHKWNNLCPVPDILAKYGVDKYFDDAGCAIHPDYRGYRLTSEIALLRYNACKEHFVPLTGAWMTSIATQKTTAHTGWDTIYEIGYKELEEKLGISFQNPPPTIKYNVKRIISA